MIDVGSPSPLYQYIAELQRPSILALLSATPLASKFILQNLSPLSQVIVSRLVVGTSRVDNSTLNDWVRNTKENRQLERSTLRQLEDLGVVNRGFRRDFEASESSPYDPENTLDVNVSLFLQLTDQFERGIKASFSLVGFSDEPFAHLTFEPATNPTLHPPLPPDLSPPQPSSLTFFSSSIWSSILNYLLGSFDNQIPAPEANVASFIYKKNLMTKGTECKIEKKGKRTVVVEKARPSKITRKGFAFMLMDVKGQVWSFLSSYLNDQPESVRHSHLVLFLALSYAQVGKAYKLTGWLTPNQMKCARDLMMFGMCFMKKEHNAKNGKDQFLRFYPTELCVGLLNGREEALSQIKSAPVGGGGDGDNRLKIIVQTNFQVIAYTSPPHSLLHLRILSLFCDKASIINLPNANIMNLTRDSVKTAFKNGITSGQIINYFKMHSHPILRQQMMEENMGTADASILPSNICDQLKLWEREGSRIVVTKCFMLQCNDVAEFEEVVRYDEDGGFIFGGGGGFDNSGSNNNDDGLEMETNEGSGIVWQNKARKCAYFDLKFQEKVEEFVRHYRSAQLRKMVERQQMMNIK